MATRATTTKKANTTRAQRAKAANKAGTKRRAETSQTLQAAYKAESDGPVLTDLVKNAKQWIQYHHKVAQDGVGSKPSGRINENGQPEFSVVTLTQAERVSHLDKAAGIQEVLDHIDRKIDPPKLIVKD